MMHKVNPFVSWSEITKALETEFGPSPYECPRANLFKLVQSGFVAEYYIEFTSLANRTEGVSNQALLDCFIGGLNADIRRDVMAMAPIT